MAFSFLNFHFMQRVTRRDIYTMTKMSGSML